MRPQIVKYPWVRDMRSRRDAERKTEVVEKESSIQITSGDCEGSDKGVTFRL